jgi:hypothetical protein
MGSSLKFSKTAKKSIPRLSVVPEMYCTGFGRECESFNRPWLSRCVGFFDVVRRAQQNLADTSLLKGEHLSAVLTDFDFVADARPAVEALDDVSTDGVHALGFDISDGKPLMEVVEWKEAADADGVAVAHEIGCGDGIEFVLDLADDFLQHVFHGDDALGEAIFIDDDGQMEMGSLELAKEPADGHQFGNEEYIALDFTQVDLTGADDVDGRSGQTRRDCDRFAGGSCFVQEF